MAATRYRGAHRPSQREPAEQSAGRRLSVITIDQAIAGASNVLIAVLAARILGVASFGLFGIVFLTYIVAQGVSRALVCDPLLVHPIDAQERPGEPIATSAILGLGLGAAVLLSSFGARAWQPRLGDALIVLAVCVPLLVFQDLGRYLAFATQRPGNAVILDTTWLVLLFGAVAVLLVTDRRTLTWFIVAWAGSGALAGLLLFRQHAGVRLRWNLAWLRHTWSFSWRYLVSYSSTQGTALAASSAVGGLAGPKALGGVQGTILLARPFGTFQIAAVAATVGEIARSSASGPEVRRRGSRTSALTTAVGLINAVVMIVLPDRLGKLVLGDTWQTAQPLLLPTAVQIVVLGMITGARGGLLGMRLIRRTMVIDIVSSVLVLGATASGAAVDAARGALWAVAAAQGLMVIVWWAVLWSQTSHPQPPAEGDVTEELPPDPAALPAAAPPVA